MINAAKNKCSDVSIFKGKARNVDYMSSCKLRVLEKKVLFSKFCPCINTLGPERQWLLACRALFYLSGIFLFFFNRHLLFKDVPLNNHSCCN